MKKLSDSAKRGMRRQIFEYHAKYVTEKFNNKGFNLLQLMKLWKKSLYWKVAIAIFVALIVVSILTAIYYDADVEQLKAVFPEHKDGVWHIYQYETTVIDLTTGYGGKGIDSDRNESITKAWKDLSEKRDRNYIDEITQTVEPVVRQPKVTE